MWSCEGWGGGREDWRSERRGGVEEGRCTIVKGGVDVGRGGRCGAVRVRWR